MNIYYALSLTATLLLIGCDSTSSDSSLQEQFVSNEYTCENGKSINVTYSITELQSLYAKINHNNSIYKLERVRSASGEKYTDGTNTWWSKGDTGFLQVNNITVLKNCTSYKPIETQALKSIKRMHPSWDTNNDAINDCESDGSCDHTIDYSKPRVR